MVECGGQERILRQMHTIRCIPVSEVHFAHKEYMGSYWVYGLDLKVLIPSRYRHAAEPHLVSLPPAHSLLWLRVCGSLQGGRNG